MILFNRSFQTTALTVMMLTLLCISSPAAETSSADQEGVAITIYNSNIGLVKDTRSVSLPSGMFELMFTDVASKIDVGSVHFKSLTDPDELYILEQNYEFDLVSQDKILDKYLGMEVQFELKDGKRVSGTLLSHGATLDFDIYTYEPRITGGWVVDIDGELHLDLPGTPILPELPEGLITRPTLIWLLGNDGPSGHKVEMSYLTDGLNWAADYVAIVSEGDDEIELSAWVSLTNKSGATYKDATLKLVAGDIHRVPRDRGYETRGMYYDGGSLGSAGYGEFGEEAFFEYHLYTLSRPTTLKDNQTKQISLFTTAGGIPTSKVYVFDPGAYQSHGADTVEDKADVKLKFMNSAEKGLGIPLPKGIVRVYKADASGMLQFIGEDNIKHTPKDEELTVLMGEAFDIVGERRIVNKRVVSGNIWEYEVEVEIRNHKPEDIEVRVVEHAGGDWTMIKSSHEFTQEDASTLHFILPVETDGEALLTYTIHRNR